MQSLFLKISSFFITFKVFKFAVKSLHHLMISFLEEYSPFYHNFLFFLEVIEGVKSP